MNEFGNLKKFCDIFIWNFKSFFLRMGNDVNKLIPKNYFKILFFHLIEKDSWGILKQYDSKMFPMNSTIF